ncbi:MAG TPA: NAD(P)-dependent alcohol dehydrogenase [Methylomirabilota bacterium]
MRAARLHAYSKPLTIEEVPNPRPAHGQVVVRVEGAGFCHSDVHVIDGEIPVLPRLPVTLGHENAGTVAEVGSGVSAVRAGDRVLVYGGWGEGSCDYCVSGVEQLCEQPRWGGLSDLDGGYAEYLLVPHERYLVKLERLEPRQAAPLADAALTPYRAIKRALPYIDPQHGVLVIGVGGLGQYGLKLLRLMAAADVVALDVAADKRDLARQLGAARAFDPRDPGTAKQILEVSRGGVSASFDFVGADSTLALALEVTRPGGKVSQIGLAGGTARLTVPDTVRFEVAFEATLWGTIKELREVVALAESGRLTPIDVELAPLEAINEVHRRVKAGDVRGRVVITP